MVTLPDFATRNALEGDVSLPFIVADGAVADGVSNSSSALAKVIDAAPDGSTIVLPDPGTYMVDSDALIVSNKTLRIIAGSRKLTKIKARSAGTAVLKAFNAPRFTLEDIEIDGGGLANYAVWLDTDNVMAGIRPSMTRVRVTHAVIEGLRICSSLVNNYEVDLGTFISCEFEGSPKNVGIHSSNAIEHNFYQCVFANTDGFAAPTYNLYIEGGGANIYGCVFAAATSYDIFAGTGSFLRIMGMYTESNKIAEFGFNASHLYPTILKGIIQNVNFAGTVIDYEWNGPLVVTGCRFGGDVYIGQLTNGTALNNEFAPGRTFIGDANYLKNLDRPGNRTFVTPNGVQAAQSFVFEITNPAGPTLQHRMMADANGTAPTMASRINGASAVLANTPSVAAGVPFVSGAGINAAAPQQIIFDTAAQFAGDQMFGSASIETNTTGSNYTYVDFRLVSSNVNGVTLNRLALQFKDAAGLAKALTTALIPAGTLLRVRFNGLTY